MTMPVPVSGTPVLGQAQREVEAYPRQSAAHVVLIGPPCPLRTAVATQLRFSTALVACLDRPGYLKHVLRPVAGSASGLDGATVVLLTVPGLPGPYSRLRRRHVERGPAVEFEQVAMTARHSGAARLTAISTVFRYRDDHGLLLHPGSPAEPSAETASAAAAERAAHLFTRLGGDSVLLRLGWPYGRDECMTARILAAARRGWQLIDGDPAAWLAMIALPDAARAVVAALTLPAGTYNVTDGLSVTQGTLNARLAAGLGKNRLHPVGDPQWGARGIPFGHSRRVSDTTFSDLTGWRPQMSNAAEGLIGELSTREAR